MAVIQYDPTKPNTAVAIDANNPACLTVQPVTIPGKTTAPATVDLTPFEGGPFRLYVDSDGTVSTELWRDHYWLLAEAVVPAPKYSSQPTGQVDEHDQPIMQQVLLPLDLTGVDITVFPLPEVSS